MTLKRGVYGIYDRGTLPDDCLERVEAALTGGMRWLQYRDKRPQAPDRDLIAALRRLTRTFDVRLIINDDWQLAADSQADGVHLGQSDPSVRSARAALGPKAIIGVSCSGSLESACAAVADDASYVSFGRFFISITKPDAAPAELGVLTEARVLNVPVIAIGGINQTNAAQVIAAGADMIAVAAGVFNADDPQQATRELAALFAHSS
ncbi:MAG: thiamine phosphate synthase [Salinisphaera sp.]|jgi:thiamine-phosphate pyrophosphorylase|nr:thiamine phosphate synthase [Salinisphaera sp.]